MPKCISYSLFGWDKEDGEYWMSFHSFLRHLMINIRMNRLLYPDWQIVLNLDQATYDAFKTLFDNIPVRVLIHEAAPLCKAMLWRMKPIFETENGKAKYSHVICRDIDAPTTYREVQAVNFWMMRDKAMHAITDSVSHDVPLMGGMIGVIPKYFTEKCGKTWEDMLMGTQMDFSKKGSDQNFLNHYVYPKFATKGQESIVQHYFKGFANTFLNDYHTCKCQETIGHDNNCPNNIDTNLPAKLIASNATCGHIGSSGYYETAMFNFLRDYWHEFEDLIEIEKEYSHIFYWAKKDAK